jgi:recombinational DNA repair protein RecR
MWVLAMEERGEVVIATDADAPGDGYADRLAKMAQTFNLRSSRLLPTGGANDWNDVLKQGREV